MAERPPSVEVRRSGPLMFDEGRFHLYDVGCCSHSRPRAVGKRNWNVFDELFVNRETYLHGFNQHHLQLFLQSNPDMANVEYNHFNHL